MPDVRNQPKRLNRSAGTTSLVSSKGSQVTAGLLKRLLSLFTDHDDVCFWQMSLVDGGLQFPDNASSFFHCETANLPKTVTEWLGRIVVAEDRSKVSSVVSGLSAKSTYIPRFSFRIYDKDGNIRWIEQRGAATGTGANSQMVWLSQDVTEKLRTANALDVTNGTLQHIRDTAEVGMIMLDSRGELTYCNPAFCAMLALQQEELMGTPISHLLDDPTGYGGSRKLARLLRGDDRSFQGECTLIGRDGKRVSTESNLWLLPTPPGAPSAFFGMVTSIEERLNALALLRQERDTLRAVFDNADIGLVLADAAGDVTAMNPIALEIFGLRDTSEIPKRTANLKRYYACYAPDGQEVPLSQWPLNRAARNDFVRDMDLVVVRKITGDSRYLRYTCTPVFDAKGQKRLVVCSVADLTEIRRLHEALSQSQRLEALGRLAGGVAHDFNNVLAVIAGNLELIADAIPDERVRARIANARDAAETGMNINQRLLTITRRRLSSHKRVDVASRIRSMVDLIERTIGSAIQLELDIQVSSAFASLDPGDLDAAFLNLVSNARDSMPKGGILGISLQLVSAPLEKAESRDGETRGEIVLSVRDTGSGMSQKTLRMAAEPFFTTKPAGKGTGLGLTGVYVFAQDCGGRVEIESKLGSGTEVKIHLPSLGICQEESINDAGMPLGSGQTVLVVEDDELVRDVTCERLLRLGYRVEQAECGDAAIDLVNNGMVPACVLSDIEMPGQLSGVLLAMKLQEVLPDCKTILCTGYYDPKLNGRERKEMSKLTILNKPYSLKELATAVRGALAGESKTTD
ncbi:PAS domain S-box-containing protein [Ensifer adhaerens]|nr:PAS domain S-box-containing protein [Ensifer adhaerens]